MILDESNKAQLINKLELMMRQMQERGLLPLGIGSKERKAIAESICNDLIKGNVELDLDNLQNSVEMRKMLELDIILKVQYGNKIDVSVMHLSFLKVDAEKLNYTLGIILPALVKESALYKKENPDDETLSQQKELDINAENLCTKILDNTNDEQKTSLLFALILAGPTMQRLSKKDRDLESEHIREMEGGVDTRIEGGVVSVVQSATLGDSLNKEIRASQSGEKNTLEDDIVAALAESAPALILGGLVDAFAKADVYHHDRTPTLNLPGKI